MKKVTARLVRGFTLIEILIGFAIMIVLAKYIMFPLLSYKSSSEFNTQADLIVAMMRDTQQKSISREQGDRWGIRFYNSLTPHLDTINIFHDISPTGALYCGASTPPAITITDTKFLQSSSDFDSVSFSVGCTKDIVFTPGSGIPIPLDGGGFTNQIIIVPKGFASPNKTITVDSNGKIILSP